MDLQARIIGGVTAVTGFEKGSGKTTFLNHLLPLARTGGPVALFTIGLDGARTSTGGGTPIQVEPGDVVMTTEAFARASGARLEVLDALPGRTALGRLLLGRTVRAGDVTLVGSEHFSVLAEAVRLVRAEGWADAVLLDGALNRFTQVASLDEACFAFTARVTPANLARTLARMDALAALADLPCVPEPPSRDGLLRLEGPLTPDVLKALPASVQAISLEDLTKCFLEPGDLGRALERYSLTVRRGFELMCLAVSLRDVARDVFASGLSASAAARLFFNPYEVRP